MHRRDTVKACLLKVTLALCCSGAWAQASPRPEPGGEQLKPYLQIKPVPGDTDVVRVFFSPSCPYSRSSLPLFKNLSASLPAGRTFEFTPIVTKADGLSYALSFLAVRRFYPAYVKNFVEASLIGVQDLGLSTRNWAGIERIGHAAHIPQSVPRLVADHKAEVTQLLDATLRRQKLFGVTNTPAVAVAGTYIVTPEFTNGDLVLFSQLVNGIISMP